MPKKSQHQLLFWIKAVFIGASLSLLLSHQAWAIGCTKPDVIKLKIEEFKDKDTKKVDAAINDVVNCGGNAIAPLKEAWITNPNVAVRAYTILTLEEIGAIEILQDSGSDLTELVTDLENNEDSNVSRTIVSSLIVIGDSVVNKPNDEFEWWKLKPIEDIKVLKKSLEKAHTIIKNDAKKWASKDQQIRKLRLLTKTELPDKLEKLTDRRPYQVRLWIEENPKQRNVIVFLIGYGIVNLGILIFFPTWLLWMDKSFRQWTFSLTGKLRLPPPVFFKYHPWVLDAWIKQRIKTARQNFRERSTVKEREIHILQPVYIEEKLINGDQILEEIKKIFKQTLVRLVIYGEGGGGKTSLAYKLAEWAMWGRDQEDRNKRLCQHRMLPILIEDDLADAESLKKSIHRQLKDLTPQTTDISEELVKQLLAQQRILVIFDNLSGLSDVTCDAIKSGIDELPLNSLVITSRDETILGQKITPTFMQPRRISVEGIANFLHDYLSSKKNRVIIKGVAVLWF